MFNLYIDNAIRAAVDEGRALAGKQRFKDLNEEFFYNESIKVNVWNVIGSYNYRGELIWTEIEREKTIK